MNQQLLAIGPPPLTVEAADCAIDVIDFMAAAVRGVDLIDVTPAVREAWRSYLASYYPMLSPQDRMWFATAPATRDAINVNWMQMPEMQRQMYRQAWAASLPGMLQFIEPVLHAAAPPASFFPAAAQPAQAMPTYQPAAQQPMPPQPSYGNPQPQAYSPTGNESISSLISQIHARQREEEELARQSGDVAHLQTKMQNDAINAQLLTNMSKMSYDAMMSVAKNLKY
jgi:hypothetical protein